jgi:hypothetical protein
MDSERDKQMKKVTELSEKLKSVDGHISIAARMLKRQKC